MKTRKTTPPTVAVHVDRVKLDSRIRFDVYALLDRAVDEGVKYGWTRAHKYTDEPSEETVVEEMHRAVMHALSEILRFDEPGP